MNAAVATSPDRRFVLHALAWSVTLFGMIRLPAIERGAIQALSDAQRTLAEWYGARAGAPVVVDTSCSGADVMALCLAVTLAYPVPWRTRLVGAAGAIGVLLTLNTLRIATLLATSPSPQLLEVLHVYVWPAGLMIAAAVYVAIWARRADRPRAANRSWLPLTIAAIGALLVFAVAAPWAMTSRLLFDAGRWTAAAGALVASIVGVQASASGAVFTTTGGAFQVTPECLLTPIIPLYGAAAMTLPMPASRRVALLLLAAPVFFALAVLRLLVLAVPPVVLASPIVVAHGFHQLLLGVVILAAAASRVAPSFPSAVRRTLAALGCAIAVAGLGGAAWNGGVVMVAEGLRQFGLPHTLTTLAPSGDLQGALVLLPPYGLALLVGLCIAGDKRSAAGLALALGGLFGLTVACLVVWGEIGAHLGLAPHALVVRGWAIAAPVAMALLFFSPSRGPLADDRSYRRFWHKVGEDFPDLRGAASTDYYFANECRLLLEHVPNLRAARLLKTDLWDEAKNTRILQWAADQGARVFGVDLSEPIVLQARREFAGRPLGASAADVRALPFLDDTFDAIYSMGTVEHFAESEAAVRELARVLKPGGCLVLGVPNKHDPFLRPLSVAVLSRLGLYAYGYERAFSRRELRAMLERSRVEVTAETGILFIPGWLRMLDLFLYTRTRRFRRLMAPAVALFSALDSRFAGLRRHGYLLASVGRKRMSNGN